MSSSVVVAVAVVAVVVVAVVVVVNFVVAVLFLFVGVVVDVVASAAYSDEQSHLSLQVIKKMRCVLTSD